MKVSAVKYLVVFAIQVKNLLEYKINIYLKLIRPIIMVAAVGALWLVLFKVTGRDSIGGFTRKSFIIYLLVIRYIAVFSPGGASITEMNEEIRTGDITMRLVKPMHYMVWLFARNLPIPLVSGIAGLLMVTLLAWFFGAPVPTGWSGVLFCLSVTAAIITQYAFYQGLGILSFWIYDVFPIERFYKAVSGLLSGELIPLTIFGAAAQSILQFLPFASLAFIPGGIYVGLFPFSKAIILVVSQFIWAGFFWILVLWSYNRGLKKFEAQGG
ncbi:MAG: ABC-2 family transporter protein [Sedimentisphaerales bacterium]|nr:ABC-2 family transporter protein [Sedimentisphaerales bacterium]